MFGSSSDEEDEQDASREIEEQLRQEFTSQVNSVKSDMQQLQNSINQLTQRTQELENKIDTVDTQNAQDDYKVDKLEDDMSQTERNLRNSISSIRHRQNELENRVENEYVPQLEKEQTLLDDIKQMMKNIRDRLGTYGNIQDTVRTATHDIDRMKSELDTKVGHTELEEFEQETRESIQRLKSRIERLEGQL